MNIRAMFATPLTKKSIPMNTRPVWQRTTKRSKLPTRRRKKPLASKKELASLPAKFGFSSVESFRRAVYAAVRQSEANARLQAKGRRPAADGARRS